MRTTAIFTQALVSGLPDKDFYYDAVLKSLASSGDDEDAIQRFEFAACLAFDGDEKARQAMYDAYNPGPRHGERIGTELVAIDGTQGLLFAAEKFGALLLAGVEVRHAGWLWKRGPDQSQAANWAALQEAALTNPRIEAYQKAAEKSEQRSREFRPRQDFRSLKYERLFEEVSTEELTSNIALMQ